MAELLKDMYNETVLMKLACSIKENYDEFDVNAFIHATMDTSWERIELKARVRKISTTLGEYLPTSYPEAIAILNQVVDQYTGFCGVVFPDFVEVYGQNVEDLEVSIQALKRYTQYSSSEFAIRPFIINHEIYILKLINAWALDDNEHVRRLASEGCRPLLPWASPLHKFKQDPTPVLEILDKLKEDPSLYVRKSVANNLNDISKNHPELIIELANAWYGKHKHTDWIVKHGCRTLLKKGNPEALAIFGYHDSSTITIQDFILSTASIRFGEEITFEFSVQTTKQTKIRLEYSIDFVKANGKSSSKVFQISELELNENESKFYRKKHGFTDLTTRKHYPGIHKITLVVNGVAKVSDSFMLSE